MAGNFRRVLIIVFFVVDLAVIKISPTKINALVYVYGDTLLCERKWTNDGHGQKIHDQLFSKQQ